MNPAYQGFDFRKLNAVTRKLIVAITCLGVTAAAFCAYSQTSLDEFSLELSPQAQEAINNGVTLTIDCSFANIEPVFLFNFERDKRVHNFTLARHALSNRYIVKRDDLSRPHIFRSIAEATNFITSKAIDLHESYTVSNPQRQMRLSLNKFELPGPMRLQAFIFDEWDLDSGWLAWTFEN